VTIQRLSDINLQVAGATKPLKICVVSIAGFGKSGGIGTATNALVRHLASERHKVTLLHTLVQDGKPIDAEEHEGSGSSWESKVAAFKADGVDLQFIPHKGWHRDWAEKSWLVMEFIAKHDFDLVYFDDWQGTGFYSMLAKRAGLAPFVTQLHCVITHATRQWASATNNEYLDSPSDIEQIGLERKSIEMADVVIGPSRYLLREYESYGWKLPEKTFNQPYLLSAKPPKSASDRIPIDEIVFFGRLEARKGLWLFCEALDRIADKLRGKIVTFLGPATYAYGISLATQIVERSAQWPFQIRLLTRLDTSQALDYLKAGNRLAVMPSLADNSPCVIYECVDAAVPFVSTLGSGTEELIHTDSLSAVMVEPNVSALAEKLGHIVHNGAQLARASFDSAENLETWSRWHSYVAANKLRLIKAPRNNSDRSNAAKLPLVVFVDDGSCDLALLIENVGFHVDRIGSKAHCVVLSSRRNPLTDLLCYVFDTSKNSQILFLEPEAIAQARELILSSQYTIFLDANVEMSMPFFALALDKLALDPSAVVTCVGAVRTEDDNSVSIENLPTGDLPGLSVFGKAIGGPVWAVSPAHHHEQLSKLELYDPQIDTYVSASALGQIFMHRCRLAHTPVELIPTVGAIVRQRYGQPPSATKVQNSRAYCPALGVTPSVFGGGPAWFAISSSGTDLQDELPETDGLFPEAPAVSASELDWPGPAFLAAAFSRPELAFQLEASAGASSERLRDLARVASEAARDCPVLNLLDGKKSRIGTHGDKVGGEALYLESRLRLDGQKVSSTASLRSGGPARLMFFDVPLSGQARLEAKFRSRGADPLFIRLMAVDQRSGRPIGETSIRLARREPGSLAIDLYRVFGPATVALEFSGAEKMEVIFDTLAAK